MGIISLHLEKVDKNATSMVVALLDPQEAEVNKCGS